MVGGPGPSPLYFSILLYENKEPLEENFHALKRG